MRSQGMPVGAQLARTSKRVTRAFGDALTSAGGSVPMWLILTSLRGTAWPAQRELARSLGIEGPTLTRHLDALEEAGLVVRRPAANDRRAVQVELTEAGRTKHDDLRGAVVAFDRRLRSGLGEEEIAALGALLLRLEENVAPTAGQPT